MKSLIRLYRFLKPYRLQAIFALLLILGMVVADLLIPRLTQRIIDHGIIAKDLHAVISTALIMLGVACISAIFALINNYLSVQAAMGFAADLRSAMMRKVQSFSFGNLDQLQTGKLIVRSTSDVRMVLIIVMLSLRILARAPVWGIGAIIMLVITSYRLALVTAAFIPVIVILAWVFTRKAQPMYAWMQEQLDRLNTVLQENLAGIRVVKAFVRTPHETDRFEDANQGLMIRTVDVAQLMAIFIPAMLLILNLAIVGAVWVGGITAISGHMTVGEVVASINYLSFALFPLLMLTGMLGPISAGCVSASRIMEILDSRPQVDHGLGTRKIERPSGRIAFEKVAFSYSGNKNEPALNDISFVAEPGQTVAIVGATGSGKSSLIHLIPRFYEVTSGRVTFDGVDVRELDLSWLRSQVAIALQEVILFSGTVLDNIRYGSMSATQDQVIAAAKAAQVHDFIVKMPNGYDTIIGQRGVTLSGGQRQRIAIARALLVKPKVLILDDSTSALDIETEVKFQDALDRLIAESRNSTTRFVVAQRISTIMLADQIIVLDHGRIAATGTHTQLIDKNAIYRDIYRSQLGQLPVESRGHHDR